MEGLFESLSIGFTWLRANAAIVLTPMGTVLGFLLGRLESNRKEKISSRNQRANLIRSYKYPLLVSTLELEDRLNKIVGSTHTDWLSVEYVKKIKEKNGFARTTKEKGYFFVSSLYLIARYFCYIELINREVGFVYVPTSREGVRFNSAVSRISKIFQYKELFDETGFAQRLKKAEVDVVGSWQLHRQFQHSIGESLIVSQGERNRCMSFREFFAAYLGDDEFKYWIEPLERYIIDLTGKPKKDVMALVSETGDLRILRLVALRYWIARLSAEVSNSFKLSSSIDSNKILAELPHDVQQAIKSMPLDTSDRFLAQV